MKPGDNLETIPRMPPCPITGKPAKRKIQDVSKSLLRDMWRIVGGVDVGRFFDYPEPLSLYESDCGLMFFDPMRPGDDKFYSRFYYRIGAPRLFEQNDDTRVEYIEAARHIPAGARVLDVGCSIGGFRKHLPHAIFRGLDPFAPPEADSSVIRETLEDHARKYPGAYDAVSAFQVIEHVANPRAFVEQMIGLLKPNGLLILGVPSHPSPPTEIPNFIINAPPHHMTWWSTKALAALARELRLDPVIIADLPPSTYQGTVLWMNRLSPWHTDGPPNERYFAHRWSWHAGQAIGFVLGSIATRFKTMPSSARSTDAFMVARKRG
jgi:SAM-dependent methyltransferase